MAVFFYFIILPIYLHLYIFIYLFVYLLCICFYFMYIKSLAPILQQAQLLLCVSQYLEEFS